MTKYTVGQVTWFNDVMVFGYLKENGEASGRDVFVHHTAITGDGFKTLAEGQWVAFYLIEGPKGPQATGVIPCDSEADAVEIAMGAERIAQLAASSQAVEQVAEPVNEQEVVAAVVAEELSKAASPTDTPAPAKKRKASSSRWHWEKDGNGEDRTTVMVPFRLLRADLQAWRDYAEKHGEEFSREWLVEQLQMNQTEWPVFVENMAAHYAGMPSTEVLHG